MWGLTECGARPRENNEGEESGDSRVGEEATRVEFTVSHPGLTQNCESQTHGQTLHAAACRITAQGAATGPLRLRRSTL